MHCKRYRKRIKFKCTATCTHDIGIREMVENNIVPIVCLVPIFMEFPFKLGLPLNQSNRAIKVFLMHSRD